MDNGSEMMDASPGGELDTASYSATVPTQHGNIDSACALGWSRYGISEGCNWSLLPSYATVAPAYGLYGSSPPMAPPLACNVLLYEPQIQVANLMSGGWPHGDGVEHASLSVSLNLCLHTT